MLFLVATLCMPLPVSFQPPLQPVCLCYCTHRKLWVAPAWQQIVTSSHPLPPTLPTPYLCQYLSLAVPNWSPSCQMCWFSVFHFIFYATLTSLIPRPLSEFVSQSLEKQFLCDFKIKSGTKDRICLTVWSTEQVTHKQTKTLSKSISLWS